MKRAVLCVTNPEQYIDQLADYSLMIVNPDATPSRLNYLLGHSDYSLLITQQGEQWRDGKDYPNERVLWYTSGTTGDSKFYSFTQQQLDHVSQTIINSYQLTSNDRYLSIMPLWHAHGQGMHWATKQIKCETKFVKTSNLKNTIEFDPTFISAIPDFLKLLINQDFKNLRFVRSASSALPTHLYMQLSQRLNVPIIEAFGMTESASHCFTNPLEGQQRIGTVGLPSGIEAKIDQGRLMIKGPGLAYTGWFDTGDLADQDEFGYYRILGRSQDQINVRGIKINPLSIETQLYNQFPQIQEVAVFGSKKLKCLVSGDVDLEKILQYLLSLGSHCRPKILLNVDIIPKNNNGKISRSDLDTQYP